MFGKREPSHEVNKIELTAECMIATCSVVASIFWLKEPTHVPLLTPINAPHKLPTVSVNRQYGKENYLLGWFHWEFKVFIVSNDTALAKATAMFITLFVDLVSL